MPLPRAYPLLAGEHAPAHARVRLLGHLELVERVLRLLCALGFTAGGLNIKGLQGASLSRCTFLSTDAPYEYPDQPLAVDSPPYSTLFEEVCIGGGTERAITGLTTDVNANETYVCSCCGAPLFGGGAKFDSRTGWPSFFAPYSASAVGYSRDMWNGETRLISARSSASPAKYAGSSLAAHSGAALQ